MVRLSIRLLGPVQVSLDDQPITRFETKKGQALLAFLAVEGDQPHRRAALAEMLWPGRAEGAARANLRHTLAKLRTAIGDREALPPFLLIARDTTQFNKASDAWVDVSTFSALLQSAQAKTPASGRQTIHRLEEAVKLYRGVFLEDVSVPDSAAFEEWLLLNRERYGRLAWDALHLLAERYEQIGETEQALAHTRHQVELQPWQEEAQRQLMRLLAVTGRRAGALAQYEACRRVLAEELDIEPEEETIALYERIRDRARLLPSYSTPPHGLPVPPTPFVGREAELVEIQDRLLGPDCRLLTLVGPGGIGKTRLALAAGTLIAGRQYFGEFDRAGTAFPQGIVFVPLAPLGSVGDMVPAIADACQVRFERGQEQLFDYLRKKRLLLIIDNLEHLLDGVGLLAEILRTAPGVKILATSQERLRLQGEHVFPVPGLVFPEQEPTPSALAGVDVDTYVEAYPAIRLLAESVRRIQPAFAPGPDDLAVLARICHLLDGMPLALELAASWADALSLNDILVETRQSLDFLQTEWRDILRRQRSVRAVFDTSWRRLGQAEQALFPQLSVFRGGFTRVAAEEVAAGSVGTGLFARLLSRLVHKSFIQYDQTSDRFQMHRLLRQYGAERLAQDPVHEAEVRDHHSSHFCGWLVEQEANLNSAKQQQVLQKIEAEIENVRTACNWAASQGQAERLSRVIGILGLYYDWRESYQAGELVLGSLVERLAEAHDPSSPMTDSTLRAAARILVWQGRFAAMLGKPEVRERLVYESLALLDSPPLADQDTRSERAHVWAQLAYTQYGKDLEAARELFVQSRDLYQVLGDRGGSAYALLGLGRVARNLQDYEEAEEALTQSLTLRQATGDHVGAAQALSLLGEMALYQGKFGKSERLRRQSLAINRSASGLNDLGFTLICSGRFVEAEKFVAESAVLCRDLGLGVVAFWTFLDLSQIHLHLGDYQAARVQAEEALSLARQVKSDRNTGIALGQLGAVALAERAYALAHERCEESLAICPEEPGALGSLACLGLAARGLGHRKEAEQCLLAQLRWAVERRCFFPLPCTLSGIALLLADKGQADRAVEVYALAQSYPLVANSLWFKAVAGGEMAAAAAQLPPPAAQAARARGQTVDLGQGVAEWLNILGPEFGQTVRTMTSRHQGKPGVE